MSKRSELVDGIRNRLNTASDETICSAFGTKPSAVVTKSNKYTVDVEFITLTDALDAVESDYSDREGSREALLNGRVLFAGDEAYYIR